MQARILRPGFLVSIRSSIRGGPQYRRVDLDAEKRSDGSTIAKWETTREIADPEEYERAVKTRSKCRAQVTGVCSRSEFGLLCPEARANDLEDGIAEARRLAEVFNDQARTCHVDVYAIAGRIANDDVEASRAISSELRDLMAEMEKGIRGADPQSIRDAANRARQLGQMLDGDAAKATEDAISQARSAARELVKRVVKGAEDAATVVSEIKTDQISNARFAFLDLDEGEHEAAPVTPRVVDLEPEESAART